MAEVPVEKGCICDGNDLYQAESLSSNLNQISLDIVPVYMALMVWQSSRDIESSGPRVAAIALVVDEEFRSIFKGQPSNRLKVMSSLR